MAKKLKLTFTVEGNSTMVMSLDNPADGLTKTSVAEAAAKIYPVLITNSGAAATGLKEGKLVTTSEEDLPD